MNGVPLLIPVWVHFLLILGSVVAPRSVPKLVQQMKNPVKFWNLFSGLETLQVPLESRLEPLMLVLRAPKNRKV